MELGGVNSHPVRTAAAEPIDAAAELLALRQKLAAAHAALADVVASLQAASDVGVLRAPALLANLQVVNRLIAEIARRVVMHLISRGELRRAMLAQLAGQQCGGLNVEAIVSAFVEQLIALRDSFEHEVGRFKAGLEAELAAAKRELKDLQSELNARDRDSNIMPSSNVKSFDTTLRKPSDARSTKRTP